MMMLRKSADRGNFDFGWLKTFHTFSFGDYIDPDWHNFRELRVINEDFVKAGMGFGAHPHRDMEIITYVLEGELAHKDSLGNTSVIRPGEVQRMSAGTGVTHSEFNPSESGPVHLLQIWIMPEKKGIKPGYEQKNFPVSEKRNKLKLVAAKDGREGSVSIHQDVNLYASILDADKEISFTLPKNRHAWVQVVRGAVRLNGELFVAGDGAGISEESKLSITGLSKESAEILLFDLN